MILDVSLWLLVVLGISWRFLVVLGGFGGSCWFFAVLCASLWFLEVLGNFWWILALPCCSGWFLMDLADS